jgi:hypothetical protein
VTVIGDEYASIDTLYARVYAAADCGDAEGFGACYTEDGLLVIEGRVVCAGRNEIVARNRANTAARASTARRHWRSQILLDRLDARSVRGRCYFQAFDIPPGSAPVLTHMGSCDDVIVADGGEWRFASRRVSFDYASR